MNVIESLTHNFFLLGDKKVGLPYLPCAENFFATKKFLRYNENCANFKWDNFFAIDENGDLRQTKTFKQALLSG